MKNLIKLKKAKSEYKMFKKIGTLEHIKNILRRKNYFLIFLLTSILSFIIFYFLTLATVADRSFKIFVQMNGVNYTFATLLLLAIISLSFGIYLSLFIYRIKIIKKASKSGFFGALGMVTGLFSAGCPMCGGLLFAVVGMPLALFFLPFKGLELKILSVILLFISIYFISKSVNECKICKLR